MPSSACRRVVVRGRGLYLHHTQPHHVLPFIPHRVQSRLFLKVGGRGGGEVGGWEVGGWVWSDKPTPFPGEGGGGGCLDPPWGPSPQGVKRSLVHRHPPAVYVQVSTSPTMETPYSPIFPDMQSLFAAPEADQYGQGPLVTTSFPPSFGCLLSQFPWLPKVSKDDQSYRPL